MTFDILPQRDLLRDLPSDETHFELCDESDAEIFAVVNADQEILFDARTRAAAEEWIRLERQRRHTLAVLAGVEHAQSQLES